MDRSFACRAKAFALAAGFKFRYGGNRSFAEMCGDRAVWGFDMIRALNASCMAGPRFTPWSAANTRESDDVQPHVLQPCDEASQPIPFWHTHSIDGGRSSAQTLGVPKECTSGLCQGTTSDSEIQTLLASNHFRRHLEPHLPRMGPNRVPGQGSRGTATRTRSTRARSPTARTSPTAAGARRERSAWPRR